MANGYRILHLGMNFRKKVVTTDEREEIELILNKAKDWYRYAPNCWLIYTKQTPKVWNERLRELPWMSELLILIAPIDLSDRAGWLTKDTWNWIKRHLNEMEEAEL